MDDDVISGGLLRSVALQNHGMDVQHQEIQDLLEFFSKNTYNAWDTHPKVQLVMQRCLDLFALDYNYSVVPNTNGELSTNYPSSLVILEDDKNGDEVEADTCSNGEVVSVNENLSVLDLSATNGNSDSKDSQTNISASSSSMSTYDGLSPIQELPKIRELFSKARYARCRARFPVPVILYNKKHICRSATLSGGPEIYGRASFDYFFSGGGTGSGTDSKTLESEATTEDIIEPEPDGQGQGDWQLFDRVRNQDIRLLKAFQVKTIVDLMVENKKVKFGVYVTSSEKVDKKNRYADFSLISLPYPGCEFFKQYRDNGYNAEKLMFDWNQGHVDANIFVPEEPMILNLDWSQYRKWDLIHLTQNYLKLLLTHLKDNNNGMLIHCISGWDRTPLFVSLLRLSLWADGVIHKTLNADQILYLTLAYDWLLFGHNLEDRLNKGEEILCFCFYFLTHIIDREYSVTVDQSDELQSVQKSTSVQHEKVPSDAVLSVELDNQQNTPEGIVSSNNSSSINHLPNSSSPPAVLENADCKATGCNGAHEDPLTAESLSHEISSSQAQSHSDNQSTIPEFNSSTSQCSQKNSVDNGECQNKPESCLLPANCDANGNGLERDESSSINHNAVEDQSPPPVALFDSKPDPLMNGGESEVVVSNSSNQDDVELSKENVILPLSVANEKNTLVEEKPTLVTIEKEENDRSRNELPETTVPSMVACSERCERLKIVRSRFYALYHSAIGFRPGMNDNASGSGLSVIIDNIATKVGIRAPNRSTS
ncbi:unnamed protein product [Allacma fusca]|uniref:Myotubularin phosphatase domain-containing protein n=1 Tax=Allacma fusca TaxID=39272 RepID=A0A8J2PDH7_9HEXA|nr:unnamed protein product [Allacma fusca]